MAYPEKQDVTDEIDAFLDPTYHKDSGGVWTWEYYTPEEAELGAEADQYRVILTWELDNDYINERPDYEPDDNWDGPGVGFPPADYDPYGGP
jgi:hypothetical protein